jgi:hypothetical protein
MPEAPVVVIIGVGRNLQTVSGLDKRSASNRSTVRHPGRDSTSDQEGKATITEPGKF